MSFSSERLFHTQKIKKCFGNHFPFLLLRLRIVVNFLSRSSYWHGPSPALSSSLMMSLPCIVVRIMVSIPFHFYAHSNCVLKYWISMYEFGVLKPFCCKVTLPYLLLEVVEEQNNFTLKSPIDRRNSWFFVVTHFSFSVLFLFLN